MLSTQHLPYTLGNKGEIHPDFKIPETRIIDNGVLYVRYITPNTYEAIIIRSPITADWYIIKLNNYYEIRGTLHKCTSIYSDTNELYVTMDDHTYIGSHLILALEHEIHNQIDLREVIPWDM